MKHPSGPSDGELHARLNAFLQADAESETADEDTIRDEVQQLTGHLPAKASDEPAHAAGQRTTDHRRMSTGNRVRWGSLWSILEPVLLVIAGSSLAVSLMAARATTLISVVAAAVATATVLALVYVRTASHGWTTSQARADLLIRQWEREDRRQVMTWERQDRLRDLAYAREDALRRALWERQDLELAYAREDALRRALWERQDLELAYAREDAVRREELEDVRRRWTWECKDRVREEERQDRLRHEELATTREALNVRLEVLKQLVARGNLDMLSPSIDDLLRSLTMTPADAPPSEVPAKLLDAPAPEHALLPSGRKTSSVRKTSSRGKTSDSVREECVLSQ